MKGTEKQITWANEILANINAVLDDFLILANADPRATAAEKAAGAARVDAIRTAVNGAEYAGDIIALFRDVKRTNDPMQGVQMLWTAFRVKAPETEAQRQILDVFRRR